MNFLVEEAGRSACVCQSDLGRVGVGRFFHVAATWILVDEGEPSGRCQPAKGIASTTSCVSSSAFNSSAWVYEKCQAFVEAAAAATATGTARQNTTAPSPPPTPGKPKEAEPPRDPEG
eukprot:GHVT01074450.1.p1 GENE.GHVT01074450.1~~GHVT01074450.1.p1  ORF type:complete len:118 (-),score=36.64 GHVT01074450.1:83-436(-)